MKSKILGLLAVGLLAGPMAANALTITTSAGQYEVTTVMTTYDSSYSLLTSQVWFGNSALASEFAGIVADALGLMNNGTALGPLFTYEEYAPNNSIYSKVWVAASSSVTTGNSSRIGNLTFAVATATRAVPEPGTLALLGLGLAGLGLSRRRKTS